MATQTTKLQENRVALREWFLENPNANIHSALNLALKEKRAAGLTRDLASALRTEALAELNVRAEARDAAAKAAQLKLEAEEAARAAVTICARCGLHGHWASECTAELPPLPAPPSGSPVPPAVFVLSEEDHVDAPETQLKALQFVLLQLVGGAVLTLSGAREAGAEVGTPSSWRRAFEALLSRGLLERATGKGFSAHLWAAQAGREEELRTLAENELRLAGTLWQGSESDGLLMNPLDDVEQLEPGATPPPATVLPVPVPSPPAPLPSDLVARFDALFNLMEANLQVSQGILNLLMAQRRIVP